MIGTTLGPYRIDRELGSGGMGRVYAATALRGLDDVEAGTRVALKILHAHLFESPGFFDRFLREAQIGRAVRHPNVVRTLDCGIDDGRHYMAMEYVEGQTLRDLLGEMESVPEELCRHAGREIARGLAAIHAAGAIHRDVKPENVLITPDYVIKVMDLGVARLVDEATRLSQTGAFVGSLQYAAPESFRHGGADADARLDLHALGLVLYELAGAPHPYFADDIPQTIEKVLHGEPRRLGDVRPQISPFYEEVVHALLEKDREQRFATAAELASVLDEGEEGAWWRTRVVQIRAETRCPLRRAKIPRPTAVYGREDELAKLRALFDAAKSGDGQVCLVDGEAGIGKSRLVDELVARLQKDGEILHFLFGDYPPGGAATAAGAFSTAYREQFGERGSAEYLTGTPLLVPAFDALLRGDATPPGAQELTRATLQTCFVNATLALALEQPTVVLIDDLQFAPEAGRTLFTALAMGIRNAPVLLIGAARPGLPDEWLSGLTHLPHARQLTLPRLGAKDLARLLEDSFGSESLARDLGHRVALKSDGNPFFVFEIIRGLREGQFIAQRADGTWVGTRLIDDIAIPSSVLDLVAARVSGLSEDERDALDVAACCGYEFDPLLVGEVLGIPRIPILKRLGQIERRHRLVRAVGVGYVFDHHQVQEALYRSISELLRREYHAALGDALERRERTDELDPTTLPGALGVELCEHFLRGAQGARAVRYLDAALTHLEGGYLNAEAVDLAERALAAPGLLEGTRRVKTLIYMTRPLDLLGRRDRQLAAAQEADSIAAATADAARQARAAGALGWARYRLGDFVNAEAAVRRALDLAVSAGDVSLEASAMGNLGAIFYSQGRFAEAREQYGRSLALVRSIGDRRKESRAMGNLGAVLVSERRLGDAGEMLEQRLLLASEIGDRAGESAAHGQLGILAANESRVSEAEAHYGRHIAIAREIGDRAGEASGESNLGALLIRERRFAEARPHTERSLGLARAIGEPRGEVSASVQIGEILAGLGDLPGALEQLREALTLADDLGALDHAIDCRISLGSLLADAGDIDGAREHLLAALDAARANDLAAHEVLALCQLARLPGGDVAAARAALATHETGLAVHDRDDARRLLQRATGGPAR